VAKISRKKAKYFFGGLRGCNPLAWCYLRIANGGYQDNHNVIIW